MSNIPTSSAPAPGTMPNGDTGKVEESKPDAQMLDSGKEDVRKVNWESELQLVSSLAKLQELERKVSISIQLSTVSFLEHFQD